MGSAAQPEPVMTGAAAQTMPQSQTAQPPAEPVYTSQQPAPAYSQQQATSAYPQQQPAPAYPQQQAPAYPQQQPAPAYPQQQAPAYIPAPSAADTPPTGKYAVMSTGSFILTSILFAIPVVGLIACIVMAFASKNLNRKHYAKAMLIFMIIGLVLAVILYFVSGWVLEAVTGYLGGAFLS